MISTVFAAPDDVASTLAKFAELQKKSASITKESTEKDVVAILGEPLGRSSGAWTGKDTKILHYHSYTDAVAHRSLSVVFDPSEGCTVSQQEITRESILQTPLIVSTGTVVEVFSDYPVKGGKGFLLTVRFMRESGEFTIGVAVENLDRVKGNPVIGSAIRVEHYNSMNYIFIGVTSLYLESMTFSGKGN